MTLGDRLNTVIERQGISKVEFAKSVGITVNYLYILTGNSRRDKRISPTLAQLIALKYGCDADWLVFGNERKDA